VSGVVGWLQAQFEGEWWDRAWKADSEHTP
jgi:hypothetical protein